MNNHIARWLALAATVALTLPAANADTLSTSDKSFWQQSTDGGGTWTGAQSGVGSYPMHLGSGFIAGLWPDGIGDGQAVEFRSRFSLASGGTGTIWVYVDDDAHVSINGHVVIADTNGVSSEFDALNIGSYLVAGTNEIEVSAVSNYCCGRTFVLNSDLTASTASAVPEPASAPMWLLGAFALAGVARRRKAA